MKNKNTYFCLECGWRPSTQQLGKYERVVASLAATSLRPGRVARCSYRASHLEVSIGLGVDGGGVLDTRRPFLPDLYCCSITESTGNLHVRECSGCGMEKAKQIWKLTLEQMNRGIVDE